MNQSVLVTGATNGTGYAIAARFAKEGYDVFITSRELSRAQEAVSYTHLIIIEGQNFYIMMHNFVL